MLGASGRRRARRKSQFGSCVPAQQDVQASTVAVDEAQIIRLIGRVAPRRAFFCRPSTPPAQGLQRQGPPERPRGRGAPGRRARERRQGSAAPRDAEPPSPTPSEAEAPPGRRSGGSSPGGRRRPSKREFIQQFFHECPVHGSLGFASVEARDALVLLGSFDGPRDGHRQDRWLVCRPPGAPPARTRRPRAVTFPVSQATRRRGPRRRGSSSAARTRCSRSGSAASRRSTRRACSPSSRASSAPSRI